VILWSCAVLWCSALYCTAGGLEKEKEQEDIMEENRREMSNGIDRGEDSGGRNKNKQTHMCVYSSHFPGVMLPLDSMPNPNKTNKLI
jgi:hypothetical protein